MLKKKSILLVIVLLLLAGLTAFSEDENMTLYIDQTSVDLNLPVLKIDDQIMVPAVSLFTSLGAQVYESDIITSYYLNTFVKIDEENNYYAINGKKYLFDKPMTYRDSALYVPLELLLKAFDLTIDYEEQNQLHLNANTVIQYRNYDAIQYKQISFEEDAVRFSVPLDWGQLDDHTYGYDSSYGRISVNFSSRMLNDNIDLKLIMDTYEEHLLMKYTNDVSFADSKQLFYNYLTSNVLYIDLDVNEILSKQVVHFVESENQIYIIEFSYPTQISQSYILEVINNIMDSFYIDSISFDADSEHYIETMSSLNLNLELTSKLYSNMTVEDAFLLEGYLNTETKIESLTVTISRKNQSLDFFVPVENNSFHTYVYTPFGLGKHNVRIAISSAEEKVIFVPSSDNTMRAKAELDLLRFSVVNLSDQVIKYSIPTKNVQSNDELIVSMSNLLSYGHHTNYSKARSMYDFIQSEITILPIHDVIYTAKDVYEVYEGTKKEAAFYLTALLRAQNIPARILEGRSDFNNHVWIEAFLNGSWLILDPVGDTTYNEILTSELVTELKPSFNGRRSEYNERYNIITILEY